MKRDDIVRMALEAGLPRWYQDNTLANESLVLKFATLIAEAERKECAKICDILNESWMARRIRAREQ